MSAEQSAFAGTPEGDAVREATERWLKDREPTLWHGTCGYWTEDWDKLALSTGRVRGIPLCPQCGAPGFVQSVAEWWQQVDAYEADGHPAYRQVIEGRRERCPKGERTPRQQPRPPFERPCGNSKCCLAWAHSGPCWEPKP